MKPREFTLDNGAGLSLSVLDWGGIVTSLRVPDRHGRVDNVVLRLPDRSDVLFEMSLGLTPSHTKAFTDWRRADYIARPGDDRPRRATATDAWEIRWRVEWAGED